MVINPLAPSLGPLVHQALMYGDEDRFLTTAVPFLRRGLEDDGTVLAVVRKGNILALQGTMGRDAAAIRFVPAEFFYQHPVRTIAEYNKIVRMDPERRVWAMAEPVWDNRTACQTTEWKRYEAIVNAAFADTGVQVICAYDTRTTRPDVVAAAQRTHPFLMEGPAPYRSRDYREPPSFNAGGDDRPLPPPQSPQEVLRLDELSENDLRPAREFVLERARRHGMAPARARAFLMAVQEVVLNALKHGAPPMELRVWAESGSLMVEVVDYGHWRHDPLVGHLPREQGLPLGLWGVRLVADAVHLRTGWNGTTVRLAVALSAP